MRAFQLIEMIILLIIVSIIGAVVVPRFLDFQQAANTVNIQSIATALNTAAAMNATLARSGNSTAVVIRNCRDTEKALPVSAILPGGCTVNSLAIAANASVICTVTETHSGQSATFIGRGTP